MPLPPSFLKDGFVLPEDARRIVSPKGRRLRRLLIGTDGPSDSGKTEFALSAPGPGLVLALDRGIDGVLDNPHPPKARRNDFGVKIVKVPLPTQMVQKDYLQYWQDFYAIYKAATDNVDCRTVVIDGDSDSWELQKLAEFGKVTQVPAIMHTNVNAARRAMYARACDCGKIIIATNKVRAEYIDEVDANTGKPIMGNDGKPKRVKSGESERQGFPDQDYLFMIQLRHMYRPAGTRIIRDKEVSVPSQFGIRLLKCKANTELVGTELWGDQCNFQGLVEHVYPQVPLAEWGFELP